MRGFIICYFLLAAISLQASAQKRTITLLNQADNLPIKEGYVLFNNLTPSDGEKLKTSTLSNEI